MGNRVPLSGENLELDEIANHHADVINSLRNYFSAASPHYLQRFAGYAPREIGDELAIRLLESEKSSILTMLSALEAVFRIDYLQRCYNRRKDTLSRVFRDLHKIKGSRVGLEDEILGAWKEHTSVPASLIGDIRGAFKYRHWLAHGRYWVPKIGQKYDYDSIYSLADTVRRAFPLVRGA
jgi:hypothetical protein